MYRIEISQEFATVDELRGALEHIDGLLDGGFTSGYYPTWSLIEDVKQDQGSMSASFDSEA